MDRANPLADFSKGLLFIKLEGGPKTGFPVRERITDQELEPPAVPRADRLKVVDVRGKTDFGRRPPNPMRPPPEGSSGIQKRSHPCIIPIVSRLKPVAGPLPASPEHVSGTIRTVPQRAVETDRGQLLPEIEVERSVIGGGQVVAPGIAVSVRTSGRLLPLGFRGKALAVEASVGGSSGPTDIDDRVVLLAWLDLESSTVARNDVGEVRLARVPGVVIVANQLLEGLKVVEGNPGVLELP
jgi:hypothetical protein